MRPRCFSACLRHQHDKFIAAKAKALVVLPPQAQLTKAETGAGQQFAADEVAVLVVDALEAIEVEEGEAYREAELRGTLECATQHVVEMARVVETGAIVGDAQLLNAGN